MRLCATYLWAVTIVSPARLAWLLLSKHLLLLLTVLCWFSVISLRRLAGCKGLFLCSLASDGILCILIRARIFIVFFLAILLCGCCIFIARINLLLIRRWQRLNLLLRQIVGSGH